MSGKLDTYDSGLLNDWGGGNVGWWQDYIRAELGRAHEFYAAQIEDAEAREQKLVEALREIAAFDDKGASERLARDGSYASFDEPSSVAKARAALSPYTPAAPEMPADCHPQEG